LSFAIGLTLDKLSFGSRQINALLLIFRSDFMVNLLLFYQIIII